MMPYVTGLSFLLLSKLRVGIVGGVLLFGLAAKDAVDDPADNDDDHRDSIELKHTEQLALRYRPRLIETCLIVR